jgi:hypothetical protein
MLAGLEASIEWADLIPLIFLPKYSPARRPGGEETE